MDANEENNINNEIEINNNDNNEQVSENKEHHHHGSVCNHSHAPRRRIFSVEDMNEFLESDTKKNLLDFIKRLNEQIIGVSNKKEVKPSNTIEKIIKLLDSFRELIKNTPPHPTRSRYGNSAFKDWFEKMENVLFYFIILFILFYFILFIYLFKLILFLLRFFVI